jgi:transcriptional regulator with XRE-family HTH domain
MSENPRGIASLNWDALVNEALRRREAEKLTQREHAALANVSVPTMAAFDRGETTLTLAKAFDILRVIGLIDEPPEHGAQDIFVREAFARWRSLTERLPPDSPGRFPNGWYRFDYHLDGHFWGRAAGAEVPAAVILATKPAPDPAQVLARSITSKPISITFSTSVRPSILASMASAAIRPMARRSIRTVVSAGKV